MTDFLLGPFAIWAPLVFALAVFSAGALFYYKKFNSVKYGLLIKITVAFKILFAVFLSVGQYYIWSGSEFTKLLLNSPLVSDVPANLITDLFPTLFASNLGYFLFYSWGRFWLNLLILLIASLAFWIFLRALKRHKERLFDTGEVELGFLMTLLSGWPGFVLFVPLAFVFVILISIIRGVFLKEMYTTLGYPMLAAGLICILFGDNLIKILNLTVLKI